MQSTKLISLVRYLAYLFIDGWLSLTTKLTDQSKRDSKGLLIVKTDAIGDYILFRNFISPLLNHLSHNDQTTIVCNIACKNLLESIDQSNKLKAIYIDRKKFRNNIIYRYRKLQAIKSVNYKLCIAPTFSREFFVSDWIAKSVKAESKIAPRDNGVNHEDWQMGFVSNIYTKEISIPQSCNFEYHKLAYFFSELLEVNLNPIRPSLKLNTIKNNSAAQYLAQSGITKKFIVLFIGANEKSRRWNENNFSSVANEIIKNFNYEIILCGGKQETEAAQSIHKLTDFKCLNLVGKTTLIELAILIDNSELVLSNDTAAVHITAASRCPAVFVVSNGKHLGRFIPYPKELMSHYYLFLPPQLKNENITQDLIQNLSLTSQYKIDDITPDEVFEKIAFYLEKK
ncbi:glycosyltransferase family 9 protein [Aliikangiella sp. IMCC44632]